jgi:Trypsin
MTPAQPPGGGRHQTEIWESLHQLFRSRGKSTPLRKSSVVNRRGRSERRRCASCTTGILCIALSLTIVRAFAEDPQPDRLGRGDRRVIEQLNAPWGAIGQINVTGYRRMIMCTGSLIAPNVVISAAHCVMDPWSHKPFPLDQIHFLAGVRGSSWLGHSTARCLFSS